MIRLQQLAILIVLVGLLVVAGLTVPVAASEVESADRSINETELAPNESTTVTVEIELAREDAISLFESISPAVGDLDVTNTEPLATVSAANQANDEVFAAWDSETAVTFEYRVTVPEDAEPGDTFEFKNGNYDVSGDERIEVVENESGTGNVDDVTSEVADDRPDAADDPSADGDENGDPVADDGTDTSDDSIPGFGLAAALTALVVGIVLAIRFVPRRFRGDKKIKRMRERK